MVRKNRREDGKAGEEKEVSSFEKSKKEIFKRIFENWVIEIAPFINPIKEKEMTKYEIFDQWWENHGKVFEDVRDECLQAFMRGYKEGKRKGRKEKEYKIKAERMVWAESDEDAVRKFEEMERGDFENFCILDIEEGDIIHTSENEK